MPIITSSHKNELYKVEIKSSTNNVIIADEPISVGGKDLGFSPKELLASALAACTSATLRMYANRKNWDLQEVKLEIDFKQDAGSGKSILHRKIDLIGKLDEEQRKRLLAIANACPVHKILTNQIDIPTELV